MFHVFQNLFRHQAENLVDRWVVQINKKNDDSGKYSNNIVSTTKYTWYSFFPKGLFEQFRRVANIYFAFHVAITLTPVSPVNRFSAILPFVFIIGVAMTKEAIEDLRRGKADKEVNNRLVSVWEQNEGFQLRHWKDVKVGNIVQVNRDEFFPADLLFLSSSDSDGICYVETMNLDGETNLKLRKCLEETRNLGSSLEFQEFNAIVECELPNPFIYTFVGNLLWQGIVLDLSPTHVLLRGSKLKNTSFVYGAVLFTGHKTKIMMNSTDPPSKRSSMEKRLDKLVIFQLFLLVVLSLVSSCAFSILLSKDYKNQTYLQPDGTHGKNNIESAQFNKDNPFLAGVLQFFTSIVLYGYFVPISLYVSMEIVKVVQAIFINMDVCMYYEETDKPSSARTSNLNEELGEVSTILSDKTGTLTRNEMEFFKCSIAGVSYGTGVTEVQKAVPERADKKLSSNEEEIFRPTFEKGFNLRDHRLENLRWQEDQRRYMIQRFLEILALCHTVVVEGEPSGDNVKYVGESPDEAAFVLAAKQMGLTFYKRSATSLFIRFYQINGGHNDCIFELLNTIDFSSTRKRMSVIVRDPGGQILLLCKGADNVIFERLCSEVEDWRDTTLQHMKEYGEAGLRTLALAYSILNEESYLEWQSRWINAKQGIMNSDKQIQILEGLAEEIEKNLILVGATAIEDKLQVGVPQTIHNLANAGIKIWVLTGDKMETAINIGYACNLLQHNMSKHVIRLEDNSTLAAETLKGGKSLTEVRALFVSEQIKAGEDALDAAIAHKEEKSHAIIIDGMSLGLVFSDNNLKQMFLTLALQCDSVICCRVSPKQKALVTQLVRHDGHKICLAIGDGANDVGMIQKANIGVGISGVEGQQASMAADFSIPQFRFLERLLLVHGGWFYNRISFMMKYFFYKNFVFGFSIFFCNALTMFSGQSAFQDWFLSLYNVLFTAWPVGVVAVLDQDVKSTSRLRFPTLYMQGQRNQCFTAWKITLWLVNGIIQALLCVSVVFLGYSKYSDRINGQMVDIYTVGTTMFTSIVLIVNLQMAITIQYWTWIHHAAIWGECFIWFIFLLLSGELPHGKMIELHKLFISVLAPTSSFYIIVLMGTVISLLPSFAVMSVFRNFFPEDYQIIQEIERNNQRHVSTSTKKNSSELGLELTQPRINGSAAPLGSKYDLSSGIFDSRQAIESEVESSREFDSKDLTDTRQLYGSHKSRSTPIENIQIRHGNSLSIASFRLITSRASSLYRRIFFSR